VPAMRAACVSAAAYYATAIPFQHATEPAALFVRDLLGASSTLVPPTVMLWRARRAVPAAASPPAPPTGR
jgi:hypothetical protein